MRLAAIVLAALAFTAALDAAAQAAHRAAGVVTRIDTAASKVTIKHGPVPSMKLPGMTMTFSVKDKKLFERLKKDEAVSFEFIEQGGAYVVTAVKEGL